MDVNQHNIEIHKNFISWNNKPILRYVYKLFYNAIINEINHNIDKPIVELGSGIGNLKNYLENCITTDIFENPWVDQVENAYYLSFPDHSISNLILFDVFHHLEYPGIALDKFYNVLENGGRVIIFEPCVSLLGSIVYGIFHHEPVGFFKKITLYPEDNSEVDNNKYYAAQGNAFRLFMKYDKIKSINSKWTLKLFKKHSSLSYLATGGYSKPQLLPDYIIKLLIKTEAIFDLFPYLFATRLMIVLEKKQD